MTYDQTFRLLAALVLTNAVAGCGGANQPSEARPTPSESGPAKTEPTNTGPADTQPVKTDPALTAEQLTKEYANDGKAFDAKYKDKVVTVEGVVTVPDGVDDGLHWTILGGYKKADNPVANQVNCTFVAAYQDKAAKLPRGSTIKVKGKCLEYKETSFAARLVECELLESKEPPVDTLTGPTITVTDAQLAKEYEADPKAADKKYGGQVVEINGAVLSADASDLFLLGTFDAKNMKGLQLYCELAPGAREKAALLTPGQKVKIKGRCTTAGDGCVVKSTQLTEIGPDPALPVTAATLTQEYAKGEPAADKKYKGKQVIVEGVIAELGMTPDNGLGPRPIIFVQGFDAKAAKPIRVEATFATSDPKLVAGLAKGQTIKVKGECVGKKGDNVVLWYVRVVK